MSSSEASLAKSKGNDAFRKGDFKTAITHFTEAINHDGNEATYYSNRSACYTSLGNYKQGLEDAIRCIELKRGWHKGYGRKGDALWGLRRHKEAIETYNTALSWTQKGEGDYKGKIAQCERAQKEYKKTGAQPILYAIFVLNLAIIVQAVLYVVPLGAFSYLCYYRALKCALLMQALSIYSKFGVPKFDKEYLFQIIKDPQETAHYFFPCLFFLIANPFMMALAPTLLRSVQSVAVASFRLLPASTHGLFRYPMTEVIKRSNDITDLVAKVEVGTGFLLLLQLFTPGRNVLLLMMYWQFMRIRYMVSDRCKASFTQVRLLLDGYLLSPSCPGFISGAYSKAVAYAWSYVDPEQQKQSAEQTQSMMSKCSIM